MGDTDDIIYYDITFFQYLPVVFNNHLSYDK